MGCVESKKSIEVMSEGEIKLVCSVDVLENKNNKTQPTHVSGGSAEKFRAKFEDDKSKKSKFDPRVTAKYELKGTIGQGSFTSVVWVENRRTKQPFAIKIYENKEARRAFEAELSILSRVKCPHVIKLIEVFESLDKMYLVMELATGGSLMDRVLEKGPCAEKEAIRVLNMVLEGVSYLHNLGITHRDLKPDNVLFYHPGANSRLMITDFGLAHARGTGDASQASMSTVCGTPEYVAPEVVRWAGYTCAVDLWAAGVLAYIVLRADFPFYHSNRAKLYRAILAGQYSLDDEVWARISQSGKDFVSKLLEVDPEARMTAAAALAHPWLRHHRHHHHHHHHHSHHHASAASSTSSRRRRHHHQQESSFTGGGGGGGEAGSNLSSKSSSSRSSVPSKSSLHHARRGKICPSDLPQPYT